MSIIVQSLNPASYINPQWIATPLSADRSLLVLSGSVNINFGGYPKLTDPDLQLITDSDIARAATFSGLGNPPLTEFWGFQAEQYATFGGCTAVFDKNEAVNFGFAVNSFQPYFAPNDTNNRRIVQGVQLSISVEDVDAEVIQVGYHLIAVGNFIIFTP
jgi:hypothetical protein